MRMSALVLKNFASDGQEHVNKHYLQIVHSVSSSISLPFEGPGCNLPPSIFEASDLQRKLLVGSGLAPQMAKLRKPYDSGVGNAVQRELDRRDDGDLCGYDWCS